MGASELLSGKFFDAVFSSSAVMAGSNVELVFQAKMRRE
jgi:hypothetical protein